MRSNTFSSELRGAGCHFAIICARFNADITNGLLLGAQQALMGTGVAEDAISVYRVPGSFELALMAQKVAQHGRYDAIVCLGAVIQGETPHFEYVCKAAQEGVLQVGLKYDLPVTFGVITALTMEQAEARSGNDEANVGRGAALAAVEMVMAIREMKR